MKPQRTQLKDPGHAMPRMFNHAGKAFINADVDRKYRLGLIELVNKDGGKTAKWYIARALEQGPSRGGYEETVQHFGGPAALQEKLLTTVQIVEAVEISMPGFGQWLALTGYGNDKTMIKGFIAWAEYKNGQGTVMTERADHARGKLLQ